MNDEWQRRKQRGAGGTGRYLPNGGRACVTGGLDHGGVGLTHLRGEHQIIDHIEATKRGQHGHILAKALGYIGQVQEPAQPALGSAASKILSFLGVVGRKCEILGCADEKDGVVAESPAHKRQFVGRSAQVAERPQSEQD